MAASRLAVAVVSLLAYAAAVAADDIPDRFVFRYGADLIWISRSDASPSAEGAPNGCDVSPFNVCNLDLPAATTFEELMKAAATRTIVSGIVSRSEVGLHLGLPYTVLQIEADVPIEGRFVVHLLYPRGKLRLDGMTVCNGDPTFAPLPAVGDFVTFVIGGAIDSTGTLFTTGGSTLVYDHDGKAVLPPALEADAELRRIASARKLAQVLREANPRP